VVSVTVYLTDMAFFPELNEVYAARVPAPYPARATVVVAALPGGARVELAVIARGR
jgi:2-iminobutanoate/2-iminopropanoate deaminase